MIVGTALNEFTTYLGGDSYSFTSPNFKVIYSGDTLTSLADAFSYQGGLTSLDKFTVNTNNVTSMNSMFDGCYSLTDLKFGTNLKVSLSLSDSPLTHASALSVLNGLAAITTSKTITFKTATYSTLTAAEIKTATDKGWTIRSA